MKPYILHLIGSSFFPLYYDLQELRRHIIFFQVENSSQDDNSLYGLVGEYQSSFHPPPPPTKNIPKISYIEFI